MGDLPAPVREQRRWWMPPPTVRLSPAENPYRHAHIYPQEIECPACEWAAAQEEAGG